MRITNILLVEDDQLDIMDFQRTLNKMNILFSLSIAKNGEEAIQILDDTSIEKLPDFVLIDLNMPKMNGIELLGVIRQSEKWKNLKCFVITTSDENVDKEAVRKLGVSGYIVKPFKLNNTGSMDSLNLMIDLMNS
jgi:CheY-like chemotaxis protein